ncbi:uncharacterized membrane protein YoaT (DUF817 family) [Bacillus sp. RC145]|uniref:Uncharacterized protein n=1 Tax=Bacillus mycoides TaxID=1405 RepID=A0AAP8KTQ8_BACMY|nr:hypothetical protein BAWEI_54180 [Bacillus mycoides]PJN69712.1 hypothetical protein BACWE_34620 [Bacillus mycoides]
MQRMIRIFACTEVYYIFHGLFKVNTTAISLLFEQPLFDFLHVPIQSYITNALLQFLAALVAQKKFFHLLMRCSRIYREFLKRFRSSYYTGVIQRSRKMHESISILLSNVKLKKLRKRKKYQKYRGDWLTKRRIKETCNIYGPNSWSFSTFPIPHTF